MTPPEARTPDGNRADAGNLETYAAIVATVDAERKAEATMVAGAALVGCTLHRLASGGWLLCRWGLARELPDLAAVGALLRAMGART